MEEQQEINPLAVAHLLQQTLRSLCIQDNSSRWVYAVFWRILPRNYPPPKWDLHGGMYDRSKGNRRNWILAWEDGFCNFGFSTGSSKLAAATAEPGSSSQEPKPGLQPEVFFKMSHEIYNYGEGIIGKVAADQSHKWVYKEPDHQDQQETSFLSPWNNPADSHPRTWEAQFQSGIKTIALIAVREGVVQLGSVNKVIEDLSSVILLRKKFAYLGSIPGVLLPHPSSSGIPVAVPSHEPWHSYNAPLAVVPPLPPPPPVELYDQYLSHNPHHQHHQMAMGNITPLMSSLEALLSKLPSVGPAAPDATVPSLAYYEMPVMAKEEIADQEYGSGSMSSYHVDVREKSDHQGF